MLFVVSTTLVRLTSAANIPPKAPPSLTMSLIQCSASTAVVLLSRSMILLSTMAVAWSVAVTSHGDGVAGEYSPGARLFGRQVLFGAVCAGHQRGEIIGMDKRRRRWRAPVEQAPGTFEGFRSPQLVVHDAIHVRVVLGEIAGRISEVPKEIGTGVVATKPPDVALGMILEHRRGAAANVVDIVELPGGVV